ncbi:MAG: CocE/NonD family hydrolase, partial [Humibacter sp.]
GGELSPGSHEDTDAQDTVVWLRKQPWFNGRLATAGGSYLGYTQWALSKQPPPELTAQVMMISVHDFGRAAAEQGPLNLLNLVIWSDLLANQEKAGAIGGLVRAARAERNLAPMLNRLPLRGMVDDIGGKGAPWFDTWVDHPDPRDPFWDSLNMEKALERTTVPTLLLGGRNDFFFDQTLQQYNALRDRGVEVALTLGPWTHLNVDYGMWFREALAWLDEHTANRSTGRRDAPVHVLVGGVDEWQSHETWPPQTPSRTLFLASSGKLEEQPPNVGAEDATFCYDPSDPTPSVGGRLLAMSGGARDNAVLEARDDVLTFTTDPLASDIEVQGAPVAEISITSDSAFADLFVRLCDVDQRGRSTNVTDHIVRFNEVNGKAGVRRTVSVTLDPTAHRFLAGHCIRLQVSGGAFPRFSRNLGVGDSDALGTMIRTVTHTVHVGADGHSVLRLPVVS